MKEKFTKPEINILMNVIITEDKDNQKSTSFYVGNGEDIIGSIVEGDNEDW